MESPFDDPSPGLSSGPVDSPVVRDKQFYLRSPAHDDVRAKPGVLEDSPTKKVVEPVGLGLTTENKSQRASISSLPSELSIASIPSHDFDFGVNSLHHKALHPNQFDDPIGPEHNQLSTRENSELSLFMASPDGSPEPKQSSNIITVASPERKPYISCSNPLPNSNLAVKPLEGLRSASDTGVAGPFVQEAKKKKKATKTKRQTKHDRDDSQGASLIQHAATGPIEWYHPTKGGLPLQGIQVRDLGPREKSSFDDDATISGLVPIYKTPGQFPFKGSINQLPRARPSNATMVDNDEQPHSPPPPPPPQIVLSDSMDQIALDNASSKASTDNKHQRKRFPTPPSTARLMQGRYNQRREATNHLLPTMAYNHPRLPAPPLRRIDILGPTDADSFHSNLGIPYDVGHPPSTILEKFYRDPRTDAIYDIDVETSGHVYEKTTDAYGRPLCPDLTARFFLGVFTLFPPLWLLMGAGYLDRSLGIIPQTEKFLALVLATIFFTIVVVCIIIGFVVGT